MRHVGGPNASCRRLYTGVVRSMALYGAPIWADSLTVRNSTLMRRSQRVIAVRVIRGYRTISFEAACVLAGTTPWDLDAKALSSFYHRLTDSRSRGEPVPLEVIKQWREEAKQLSFRQWRERLEAPSAGHRTIDAVRPVLKEWLGRKHGSLSFRLVQVLSGHGCFGWYLHKIARREPSAVCHQCGCPDDTADHTVMVCPTWDEPRSQLTAVIGRDLSLPTIVSAMLRNGDTWNAALSFCETVVSQKEAAERLREDDASSQPMRRRRMGRRRQAHERNLPP